MPKLTLDLDQVRVESFSPGPIVSVLALGPTTRTQEPTCSCQTFCPSPC
jgi:hypothetical protein